MAGKLDDVGRALNATADVARGAEAGQGIDYATGLAKQIGGACDVNRFVPGTRVLLADGSTKAIEDVQLGDWVLAEDPETGEEAPPPVIDLIVGHGEKQLVEIQLGGSVLTATDQHPFWVVNRGRVALAWLRPVGHGVELANKRRPQGPF